MAAISLLILLFCSSLEAKCFNSEKPVELVLCWEAQEGQGSKVNDFSIYNTSGGINGSVAWVQGTAPDRSKAFTNTSSYTAVGLGTWALSQASVAGTGVKSRNTTLFDFTSKDFMVGVNFKSLSFPIGGFRALIFFMSDQAGIDGWGLGFTNANTFNYMQVGVTNLDTFGQFSDANPHRLFMIRMQTTLKVYGYLDGKPFSANPYTLGDNMAVSPNSALFVGYGGAASGTPYDGTWNTLSIYKNVPLRPNGDTDVDLLNAFAYNEYLASIGYAQ